MILFAGRLYLLTDECKPFWDDCIAVPKTYKNSDSVDTKIYFKLKISQSAKKQTFLDMKTNPIFNLLPILQKPYFYGYMKSGNNVHSKTLYKWTQIGITYHMLKI